MQRFAVWLTMATMVVVVVAWVGGAKVQRPGHEGRSAPALVDGSRRPPTMSSIRIEGEVVGVTAGGSGMLTVRVGGVVQQQVASTAGAFAVDVSGLRTSDMVSLEYEQPGAHFTSLLGSYGWLVRTAGDDARLTRQECECTRISAFSTGLEYVANLLLGHAPRSNVELGSVVRQMGYDLGTATVVLARLAADPSLLPGSHDSGLALLRDRAAFLTYLQETHYAVLQDPDAALADLPAAAITDADVPVRTAFLGPVLDVHSPLSISATVMEREGNAFTQHGGVSELGRSYVGTIDDGALVLTPAVEIAFINRAQTLCPSTFEMTDQRSELLRQELRRQWAGDRLEIWRSSTEHEISYPDCPELPNSVQQSTGFATVVDLADTRMLTNARRFRGRVALPLFCSTASESNGSELVDCAYAVHEFAPDGNGEIVDLGDKVGDDMQPIQGGGRMPFSWTMGADGAMHVHAGAERARYWVLDGGDGAALGVIYVAEADREIGNVSIAGYTAMIRAGTPDLYTASSVVGSWGYATMDFANRQHVDQGPAVRVRVVRDASGRSVQWANDHPTKVERWTTAWGRLYSTDYSDPDCIAPSAQCPPNTVRYFRPLARVGGRIHGIEESYSNGGGEAPNYGASRGWSRPQFHEVRKLPAGAPVAPPARRK